MSSVAHVELWKRGPSVHQGEYEHVFTDHRERKKIKSDKQSRSARQNKQYYSHVSDETKRIIAQAVSILEVEGVMDIKTLSAKVNASVVAVKNAVRVSSDKCLIYQDGKEIGVLMKDRL